MSWPEPIFSQYWPARVFDLIIRQIVADGRLRNAMIDMNHTLMMPDIQYLTTVSDEVFCIVHGVRLAG